MTKPTVIYFGARGRAEPIRLILGYKGVEFENSAIDFAELKSNRDSYPFGQVPRYLDDEIDMVQTPAILRHLGRKYKMVGDNEKEHSKVDMILEGVEAFKTALVKLVFVDKNSDEAKAAYAATHFAAESATQRNGGAHASYFTHLLSKSTTGWVAGTKEPSIADIALYDFVDGHLGSFKAQLEQYPALLEHYKKVGELPTIKAYLASPLRLPN